MHVEVSLELCTGYLIITWGMFLPAVAIKYNNNIRVYEATHESGMTFGELLSLS